MKKLLIIAFSFVCLFAAGQSYSTTNLDLMVDSVLANGFGWDSVSGAQTNDIHFIDIDFTVPSKGIPFFTKSSVVIYGDTIKTQKLFGDEIRNYNAADTLFIQKIEKVIGSLDTIVSQAYIARILHYSIPNDQTIFNIQELQLTGNIAVGVGKDYSDLATGITNASVNDTIYVFTNTETSQINPSNKNLTIIGVGNSKVNFNGQCFLLNSANSRFRLKSFSIDAGTSIGVRITAAVDSCFIEDCDITTTGASVNTTLETGVLTASNNLITGQILFFGDVYLYDNYIYGDDYNIRTISNITANNCLFEDATEAVLSIVSGVPISNFKNCQFNTPMWFTSVFSSDGYLGLEDCYVDADNFVYNTTQDTDLVDLSFLRTEFVQSNATGIISHRTNSNITINNCNIDNVSGIFIIAINDTTYTQDVSTSFSLINNDFQTPSYVRIIVGYTNSIINNNELGYGDYSVTNNYPYDIIQFYDNNVQFADSGSVKLTGNIEFYNNTYIQDTTGFLSLIGDSVIVKNNYFEFHAQRFQGNLIGANTPNGDSSNYYIQFNGNYVWAYYSGFENHLFNTNNNTYCYHNYIEGVWNGAVSKRYSFTDHDFEVYNNVFIDCYTPVYFRNMRKGKAINNTFINSKSTDIFIDNNGGVAISDSLTIINNVSRSDSGGYFFKFNTLNAPDTSGLISSNNICNSNKFAHIFGVGDYILSQWQSLGYDANSYNKNPNLNANGVPQKGSVAIGNGFNLGSPYNFGLSPSATFPNPLTIPQYSRWSIGAYVVDLPHSIIHFQNKIVVPPGEQIIYFNK